MDKPMDETDRKHCLLDLHGIRESICPEQRSVDFIKKWGDGLESILTEEPEDERVDQDEMASLEVELKTSEETVAKLSNGIERAITAIDKLCENPDLGSDFTTDLDVIAVALGELL